jgi:5'-3' exonuclease
MVDGPWLLHRAWSVIGERTANPTKRIPHLILDWFCSYALSLNCNGGGIAFDGSSNFRYAVYSGYKANRGVGADGSPSLVSHGTMAGMTKKDAVYASLKPTKELFRSVGIFVTHPKRYEADDSMSSAAWRLCKNHPEVLMYLTSLDKDIIQCVTDNVHIHIPEYNKIPERIIKPADVPSLRKGLTALQFLDLQILLGDGVDNVPPVPGCTPAQALKLIKTHGSLNAFFQTEEGKLFYYPRANELHRNKELVKLSHKAFMFPKSTLMFDKLSGTAESVAFTALKAKQNRKSLF